jgi:hypothetical protein
MVSICVHTQMENDHNGFEYLDSSMECVPWFMPRSHVATFNLWSNMLSQMHAKLEVVIFPHGFLADGGESGKYKTWVLCRMFF